MTKYGPKFRPPCVLRVHNSRHLRCTLKLFLSAGVIFFKNIYCDRGQNLQQVLRCYLKQKPGSVAGGIEISKFV